MYYWHWLGGHDWWYDWSLIATTSRTINHDWSYLSSSPIVSNRTLTRTTNRGEWLQMEIVWSITVWSCNLSEQLVTGRTTDRATVWHTITIDWYDWSLIATTSRTINHDWSYLSSSPIVSNRTLTRTTNRGEWLQMEIVWSITVWSCNLSEQLVTGRTTDRATVWHTITNDWWCDHAQMVVRSCKTCLRLVIADRSQTVLNMTVDWHVLSTIWQRFLHFSIVTWWQVWCDCGNR